MQQIIPTKSLTNIARRAVKAADAHSATIAIGSAENARRTLTSWHAGSESEPGHPVIPGASRTLQLDGVLNAAVGRNGHPPYVADCITAGSPLSIPLESEDGRPMGVLLLEGPAGWELSPSRRRRLSALGRIAAEEIRYQLDVIADTGKLDECIDEEAEECACERANELEERTAELEAAVHDLEAFTYSVSHDLRAPLRAINGFASFLTDRLNGDLDDKSRHYLQRITENGLTMNRLIDELLTLSRVGRKDMRLTQVDPQSIARDVVGDLAIDQPDGTMEIEISEMPPFRGDEILIRQVYQNLISNALKFSVGRLPIKIMIGADSTHGVTRYYVKDNGIGFDPSKVEDVFRVFYRLHSDEEYEGTGVGLAIAKRIIQKHDGHIWAASKPDRGAAFWFTIDSGPYDPPEMSDLSLEA